MLRPYFLGLAMAALGPFAFGFLTVEPVFFLAFAALFFLGHALLRPYDIPRGIEVIQNTGFILLIFRAAFNIGQAGLSLMAGMILANATGYPFRAINIPGRPDLSVQGFDLSTGTLLALTLGVSIVGLILAKLKQTPADVFTTRGGVLGVSEAFDRVVTRRFGRVIAMFHPQASRAGKNATMAIIRPWALRPYSDGKGTDAMRRLVQHVRPDGHQARLAHVLLFAANGSNSDAETALRVLLEQPGSEMLKSLPEFAAYI